MDNCLIRFIAICLGIWLVCAAIYVGILTGIWLPYFSQDWHHSQCIVQSIDNQKFTYMSDDSEVEAHYANIRTLVEIDGHWVKGFACGSPDSRSYMTGTMGPNGAYPYQAAICPFPDVCGSEIMLPAWFCSDCKLCDEKLTGQPTPCMWNVFEAQSSVSDPKKWPESLQPDFPVKGTSFIQIVLGTEIYYSKGEYIFLHVFGGISIIGIPLFVMVVGLIRVCTK